MSATIIFVKAKERKKVEVKYRLVSIAKGADGSAVHWIVASPHLKFNIMVEIQMGRKGAREAKKKTEKFLKEAEEKGYIEEYEIHEARPF